MWRRQTTSDEIEIFMIHDVCGRDKQRQEMLKLKKNHKWRRLFGGICHNMGKNISWLYQLQMCLLDGRKATLLMASNCALSPVELRMKSIPGTINIRGNSKMLRKEICDLLVEVSSRFLDGKHDTFACEERHMFGKFCVCCWAVGDDDALTFKTRMGKRSEMFSITVNSWLSSFWQRSFEISGALMILIKLLKNLEQDREPEKNSSVLYLSKIFKLKQ